MRLYLLFSLVLFLFSTTAQAISLPRIFGDHMVIQQKAGVTFWGWGKPLEKVSVSPGWNSETYTTTVNSDAKWEIKIQTPSAGGPYKLILQGYNEIVLKDVLLGEVWLCSGQSNMEWTARMGMNNSEKEIQNANYSQIRLFNVSHRVALTSQEDLVGSWESCSPETMIDFSAVAYFFGRSLHGNLNVPIGLINSSWGGTPAEVWIHPERISEDSILSKAAAKIQEEVWGPFIPGKAYHAMIAPLIPYRIAGVLWYQGESNTYSPETYAKLLPVLIQSWRSEWGYPFPFYYVQIAPYKYERPLEGAVLRDAQRRSMTIPNTGMVVVSDIGDINNIHPGNKQEVGIRLANWALNKVYGKSNLPVSGPLYKKMQIERKKIRVYFDYSENGLVCKGNRLTNFEIAGIDRMFVPAEARINEGTVLVHSKMVKRPVAVRFAFQNEAEPNLFNTANLPASTFRTDNWDIKIK